MTAREDLLADKEGATLVVTGDTPLFHNCIHLKNLFASIMHEKGNAATVLTAESTKPIWLWPNYS